MQFQEINNDNFAHYITVLQDAVPPHGMYSSQLSKNIFGETAHSLLKQCNK
jgi:hypothetical protein